MEVLFEMELVLPAWNALKRAAQVPDPVLEGKYYRTRQLILIFKMIPSLDLVFVAFS